MLEAVIPGMLFKIETKNPGILLTSPAQKRFIQAYCRGLEFESASVILPKIAIEKEHNAIQKYIIRRSLAVHCYALSNRLCFSWTQDSR